MAKKRNLEPESSQLVEPPLKQHQSEAQQENLPVQEDDQAFEQALGATSTPAIGQKPAFRGIRPFGRANPTSVWKQLEAVGFGSTVPIMTRKQIDAIETSQAFGSTGAPAFGATSTPAFGSIRIYEGRPSPPIAITSSPTITEEHGGTTGQTAKLESISAMPAYNYERFESCVAIAGEDYCVIAVDFTHDRSKISQLSGKSVMAARWGFQADMKALQILSAENLKYEGQHKKPMSCPEMHRLFRHVKKSHPIYDFVILGGLDSEGKGCLFKHCPPDTFAPMVGYSPQDSGSRLIEAPIFKCKLPDWSVVARLSETEAVALAKTVFASTSSTGDKLEIVVLNASGLRRHWVDLRKDCD